MPNRQNTMIFLVAALSSTSSAALWAQDRLTLDTRLGGAFGVDAADVDGDGDMDVLAAARDEDWVVLYRNEGNWQFVREGVSERRAFDGPRTAAGADLDGDGVPEIVAGALEGSEVAAWHATTDGWEKAVIAPAGTAPGARAVRGADMDGDGDTDLVASLRNADGIALYLQSADAWAQDWVAAEGTLEGAYWVELADFDEDGDTDVLGVGRFADEIAWYVNDGSGTFDVISVTGDRPFGQVRGAAAGDLDGDGDLDVAGVAGGDGQAAWFENEGDAWTFHPLTQVGEFAGARSIDIGDIDGDGDLDILAAAREAGEVAWWENDGAGSFGRRPISAVAGGVDGPYGSRLSDLDGDGLPEVLVADQFANDIIVYRLGL